MLVITTVHNTVLDLFSECVPTCSHPTCTFDFWNVVLEPPPHSDASVCLKILGFGAVGELVETSRHSLWLLLCSVTVAFGVD